jgi:hypothetical protein
MLGEHLKIGHKWTPEMQRTGQVLLPLRKRYRCCLFTGRRCNQPPTLPVSHCLDETLRRLHSGGCGLRPSSRPRILVVRMRTISRMGATLVLVLSLLGPSMVCALPFSQLTASERECCKHMQGECGGMKMPASHSCCQHNTGPNHLDTTQPQSRSVHPMILLPALLPQSASAQPPTDASYWIPTPDHSPPIPSASASSVRRI